MGVSICTFFENVTRILARTDLATTVVMVKIKGRSI